MKIYLAVVFSYFWTISRGTLSVPLSNNRAIAKNSSNTLVKQTTNGGYPKFQPYYDKASIKCNEDSNFNVWVEDWEGHSSCLQIVYPNKTEIIKYQVAVYFDENVDRNNFWTEIPSSNRVQPHLTYHGPAQWVFNFTSNVWRYMTNTYNNFGQLPVLYLLIHGNQFGNKSQHPYFHYSLNTSSGDDNKNRNILDLGSTNKKSWVSNETRNSEMDLIINQLFFFVENKFKGCLGLPSSDLKTFNSTNLYSAWTDAFTIQVYININMTAQAQRYFKKVLQKDGTDTEYTQFINRFYPIHPKYDCNNNNKGSAPQYFQIIPEAVQNNVAHPNETLDRGEFVLIWSGATQTDLRALAQNAIGWSETYHKQFQSATQKFPNIAGLFYIDFNFTIMESTQPPIMANNSEEYVTLSSTTFENGDNTKQPTSPAEIDKIPNTSEKSSTIDPLKVNTIQIIIIAGASGAGAIILILIVVLILCFVFYNKKIQNLQTEIRTLTNDEMKEFFEGDPKLKGDEAQALVLSMPFIKDFEIPRDRIVLDATQVLGSGQFGTVIHGFIRSEENNKLPVAMKTVNQNIDVVSFKAFLSEVKIMAYLGDHENIVGLLGTCTENIRNREIYIALEFCPLGNLGDYLKNIRENLTLQNSTSRSSSNANEISLQVITEPNTVLELPGGNLNVASVGVTTFDLIKWSHDISNAMMYLTQKKVIHGDLAARNILLTESRVAKISDFGLSRQFLNYANYMKTSKIPVPWRWLAIESLKDMKFSTASDVWAFGVTMWEIFSLAEIPYGAWTYDLFFVDRLIAGDRLQRPLHANDAVYKIMKDCWEVEPAQRPTFQRIYLRLGEFILKASEIAEAEDKGFEIKENSKNTISELTATNVTAIPTKIDECENQL